MTNEYLDQKQWAKIRSFLKDQGRSIYMGSDEKCQRFLGAITWMARSGAQWRLLPEKYGNWNHVYKRFAHWSKQGVFEKMTSFFAQDPDFKCLMLDSTIVRAHSCAAGALKKTAVKKTKLSGDREGVSARKSTF